MRQSPVRFCLALVLLVCVWPTAARAEAPASEPVRPAAVAGTWYPGDTQQLAILIDRLLDDASPPPVDGGRVRALVAPHAGLQYSGPAAAAAYKLVMGQSFRRVIVLAPDHGGKVRGLSIADVTHYRTPLGDIPVDLKAAARLRESPLVTAYPEAHQREHSIEMQLPLLQRALAPGWKLVPILVGKMEAQDPAEAAELLRPLADADTLIVVSGDFTHYGPGYGYLPFPPDHRIQVRLRELDMGAYQYISARDASGFQAYQERTGITTCALGPLLILLELLPESAAVALVDYYTSGERTGDFRHSVSYLAIGVTDDQPFGGISPEAPRLAPSHLAVLHRLACAAVVASVAPGYGAHRELQAILSGLPAELREPGAAFVTLRTGGRLRGCTGSVLPKEPLYRSVLTNAARAALSDRRFPPVGFRELPELRLTVSVLGEPLALSSVRDFTVGSHGIVLSKAGRQAVFLPKVATEQGWDREETLIRLSTKAGLTADAWRQGAELKIFSSQEYPPADAAASDFRCVSIPRGARASPLRGPAPWPAYAAPGGHKPGPRLD